MMVAAASGTSDTPGTPGPPAPAIPGHHLDPGSEELHRAAEAILLADDVQWTDLRALVFRILARSGEPASAYSITEEVSASAGRRVAANSVYRILDLFVAHNLAKRVESRNAYVVNLHPACQHDCIFLICDRCHRIAHLDDDQLAGAMRAQAEATGFHATRAVLELIGQCDQCRQAAAAGQQTLP